MTADHVHAFRGVSPKTCECGTTSDQECAYGHAWTDENTRYLPDGRRRCRACQRRKNKARYDSMTDADRALYNEKSAVNNRAWRARLKASVFDHYGRSCACCGEATFEFLCIDHIEGGGNDHRRELNGNDRSGSDRLYRWLSQHGFPEGFQALCQNCNFAKSVYGVCPHKEKQQ